jgi:CxxC motif-containing protein (DUF1111 family)
MLTPARYLVLALLASPLAAISGSETEALLVAASGGVLTTEARGKEMLRSLPPGLDESRQAKRLRGEAFFNTPFVPAPSPAVLRDGLGPLFNSVSCESCHNNLGRGRPADEGGNPSVSLVLQLSASSRYGTWGPHPRYGSNFNPQGVPGVPGEGKVRVTYETVSGRYADGARWEIRKPTYRFEQLAYGPIDDAAVSPRMAQSLMGMGLLEVIPEADVLANADEDDEDRDGISGRPNWIVDERGGRRLGRFGWKANQAHVRAQTVAALLAEQGINSEGTSDSNCALAQTECLAAAHGGRPEISTADLDSIVTFMRAVPVPVRRGIDNATMRYGAQLFKQAGCDACHVPAWRTGVVDDLPLLSNQSIYPFTDLLLHDMGPELADGRPDQAATGSEWRTPPLWGVGRGAELGVPASFLHDGRARTLEEAVLWHGGEAAKARAVFVTWPQREREALIAFLESL